MPPLLPVEVNRATSLLYNHMSATIRINVFFVFLFILEDYIVFGEGGPVSVPGGFRRIVKSCPPPR
jgi:hypothetical protein